MRITEIPSAVNTFLTEVKREVKKVNWPTPRETIRDTLIVIAVSMVVAIFLGGVDFLFTRILRRFII
ncbi:MAG: preprotein translocase subunit SecE [Candidatus Nealsonbacteria bacterium]|nr:preprotein translocase subunit SecE [Candidatus Nealsonbacteria bacterium]